MLIWPRSLLFAVASIVLAAPVLAGSARADAVLRPNIVVDGDVVHLGDLFDNVGDKANMVVAKAPKPGQKVPVDADWLTHIAQIGGVTWSTDNPFLQVIVERKAQTIGRDQIEQEILKALADKNVPPDAKLDFSTRNPEITIASDLTPSIGLRDLNYDPQSKRFNVTVQAPADASNPVTIQLAGRVFRNIDVPVLTQSIQRGQVLSAHDFSYAHLREDSVRPDILLDVDQLIGMAAHRTLRSGEMVSNADIERPIAVARGALVTLVLAQQGITLTTQGRAIEQGAVGDVVRVTNTHSNLTVVGKVSGTNLVSVTPDGGIALAN